MALPAFNVTTIEPLERRVHLAADLPIGGRNRASFTDADGGTVVISLKGPGTGAVSFATDGNADASLITLDGTTAASSLSIKGDTRINGLQANGSLKSFAGKTVDLAGSITVTGALPKLQFRNSFNATITIGPSGALAMKANQLNDSSLTIAGPIKSMAIVNWSDVDATPDVVSASFISSISVKGSLAAGITTGSLGKLTVAGTIARSQIRTSGSIGTISAGALNNSQVFAGIRDDLATLPTITTDFSNPQAVLQSLTLKGKNPGTFINSLIAAPTVGKVAIGPVASFSGTQMGLSTDRLVSVSASTNLRGVFRLSNLDSPQVAVSEDDFVIMIL